MLNKNRRFNEFISVFVLIIFLIDYLLVALVGEQFGYAVAGLLLLAGALAWYILGERLLIWLQEIIGGIG